MRNYSRDARLGEDDIYSFNVPFSKISGQNFVLLLAKWWSEAFDSNKGVSWAELLRGEQRRVQSHFYPLSIPSFLDTKYFWAGAVELVYSVSTPFLEVSSSRIRVPLP